MLQSSYMYYLLCLTVLIAWFSTSCSLDNKQRAHETAHVAAICLCNKINEFDF